MINLIFFWPHKSYECLTERLSLLHACGSDLRNTGVRILRPTILNIKLIARSLTAALKRNNHCYRGKFD